MLAHGHLHRDVVAMVSASERHTEGGVVGGLHGSLLTCDHNRCTESCIKTANTS
jgi:hypothetical protein